VYESQRGRLELGAHRIVGNKSPPFANEVTGTFSMAVAGLTVSVARAVATGQLADETGSLGAVKLC
jgi:hypothetical protein